MTASRQRPISFLPLLQTLILQLQPLRLQMTRKCAPSTRPFIRVLTRRRISPRLSRRERR
jgi:hypothetical protein